VGVRGYWIGLAALAVLYLVLAARVPPADDELYYWCWSQELQRSYFDHPPLTALLIRASTEVFGHSILAVRLPACLTSLAVLGVIGWLSRPRHLLGWVAFTPLFTFGAILITPDTPLMLFWAAYLLWLVAAHRRLTGPPPGDYLIPVWMWALGGVLLGLGALGKYTIALAVPAGFVSFALAGRAWREWLSGYVFHGAISFLVALPVFAFNYDHDFAPLRFQLEHATATEGGGLQSLGEFVGVQLLLFGTLPVLLFPWVVRHLRELAADPRLRACACLYAVPFGFFLFKASRGPLEGNWALAAYIGFWPVAAHWFERVRSSAGWRWFTAGTFALPAGCVMLVGLHLIEPLGLLPPSQDRITRLAVRLEIGHEAAEAVRRHGEELPVYTPSYQLTALLRWHGLDARQIDGATRPSNFTLRPEHLTDVDRAYVFNEGPLMPELAPGFDPPELVATFPLTVRGETLTYYHLLIYTRTGAQPSPGLRDGLAGATRAEP
jgi:4-amino-4-deoxy-L-arabinose transferase-like glycosyltransferase